MLGKGLESLIPQKGNNGQNPGDSNSGQNSDPSQNQNLSQGPSQSQPQSYQPSQQQSQPQQPQQPRPQQQPHQFQQARPVEPQRPATFEQSQRPQQEQQRPAKKDEMSQEAIYHIEIEKITANPDQPRRHFDQDALHELASSIREFGFLQPLVVSKIEKESPTGIMVQYQIIAGERRFMAAKMLGLPRVPAVVRNVNLEREKLELGVIENIQRENLNPIEMARAFQRLQEEFRMTQREIAAKLGKSREVVANSVRLLDLPEYIQRAVEEGQVSESNARLLMSIEDENAQKRLLEEIIQNKLTTRDVKDRIQQVAPTAGPRRGRPPGTNREEQHLAPEIKSMQDDLSLSLGAPVEIRKNANNGKITITFFSEEELENILRRLRSERGDF
jgi:ParB family chromosome partitioning protein